MKIATPACFARDDDDMMVRARPRHAREMKPSFAGPPESCAERTWFLRRTGFCRVRWRSSRQTRGPGRPQRRRPRGRERQLEVRKPSTRGWINTVTEADNVQTDRERARERYETTEMVWRHLSWTGFVWGGERPAERVGPRVGTLPTQTHWFSPPANILSLPVEAEKTTVDFEVLGRETRSEETWVTP